jgi:multicomponent K+:H+ antiporter subunit A
MRFPVEFSSWRACSSASSRHDHQALPRHARCARSSAGYALLQPRRLARLQRAPAHEHDRPCAAAFSCTGCCRDTSPRASTAPPLMRHLKGQRIFERVLVTLSWKWARSLERLFGTQRLQPQLRLLVAFALLAALWPLYRHGLEAGSRPWNGLRSRLPPALDRRGAVRHRRGLPGQVPPARGHGPAGGAGLVTCITFVWFSAPDLAITQLLVEIVTTVLILLACAGCRSGSRRTRRRPLDGRRARVRRARDLMLAVAAGAGMTLVVYADAHAATPRHDLALLRRERLQRKAADAMSSTSSWSTSAASTPSARSWCSPWWRSRCSPLLRRFRPAPESVGAPEQQRVQDAYRRAQPDRDGGRHPRRLPDDPRGDHAVAVPGVHHRVAVYLFLRGHDLPGGGFAAGSHDVDRPHPAIHGGRAPAGSRRGSRSFPSSGLASDCSARPSPAWVRGCSATRS